LWRRTELTSKYTGIGVLLRVSGLLLLLWLLLLLGLGEAAHPSELLLLLSRLDRLLLPEESHRVLSLDIPTCVTATESGRGSWRWS
jgi:hypothetical protein